MVKAEWGRPYFLLNFFHFEIIIDSHEVVRYNTDDPLYPLLRLP